MKQDLTQGSITRTLLWFALPMTVGNLLQQLYNIADTLIIGQFVGANALAAVGSSYTLMTFLTSILLGLSMGSGGVYCLWAEGLGQTETGSFSFIFRYWTGSSGFKQSGFFGN